MKFDSMQAAVSFVIGKTDIGYRSSTATLAAAVWEKLSPKFLKEHYHWKNPNDDRFVKYCLLCRIKGRKMDGVKADCRTYDGQPRRDMKNDNKIGIAVLGKLKPVIDAVGSDEFSSLLEQFHSIDQLKNAVTHITQLANHYELVNV